MRGDANIPFEGRLPTRMRYQISLPSLSLFRVLLGLYLCGTLIFRFAGHFATYFSPANGILGRCFSEQYLEHYGFVFNPLYYASTDLHTGFYLAVCIVLSIGLTLGIRSGICAFGLSILLAFWYDRYPMFYQGFEQYAQVLLWIACLLPVDRYFSLGGVKQAPNQREEKLPTLNGPLAFFALFQVTVIYFFNGIFKYGEKYLNGTAVAFTAMDPDRSGSLSGWLIQSEGLVKLLTWTTLFFEIGMILLIILPAKFVRFRYLAIVGILFLHWGVSVFIDVGNFKWISLAAAALILPEDFWQRQSIGKQLLRWNPKARFRYSSNVRSPALDRLLVILFCVSIVLSQFDTWLSNRASDNLHERANETMLAKWVKGVPRLDWNFTPFDQYWHLYAPNPATERGFLCIELSDKQNNTIAVFNGEKTTQGFFKRKIDLSFFDVIQLRQGRNAYIKMAQECMLQRELFLGQTSQPTQVSLVLYSWRPETLSELQQGPELERIILHDLKLQPQGK